VEFLAALSTAGDASCLEAVAAAYARSTPPPGPAGRKSPGDPGDNNAWWRDRLADAFQTIAKREHVTGRHAVMRKIQKRWPEIFRGL
jgi:hypothetical protein